MSISRSRRSAEPVFSGSAMKLIQRGVSTVVAVIAGLAFSFGFGQGWNLGLLLGVPPWIAPLVAPAVDLSVVVLLVSLGYLRSAGTSGRMLGPRLLLAFCGAITFALNTAYPIIVHDYGRASFDAVAPVLLAWWSEVGPRLLALLHRSVPDRPGRRQDGSSDGLPAAVNAALLAAARKLDIEHRDAVGKPITRDALRSKLRVSNAAAGWLARHIREDAAGP
jgi:hypothetical protein